MGSSRALLELAGHEQRGRGSIYQEAEKNVKPKDSAREHSAYGLRGKTVNTREPQVGGSCTWRSANLR